MDAITGLKIVTCLSIITASVVSVWKNLQSSAPAPNGAPPAPNGAPPAQHEPNAFKYLEGVDLQIEHCQGYVTGYRCAALVWDAATQAHVRCACRDWTPCTLDVFASVKGGGTKPTCISHKTAFESLGFNVIVVGWKLKKIRNSRQRRAFLLGAECNYETVISAGAVVCASASLMRATISRLAVRPRRWPRPATCASTLRSMTQW